VFFSEYQYAKIRLQIILSLYTQHGCINHTSHFNKHKIIVNKISITILLLLFKKQYLLQKPVKNDFVTKAIRI